MEEFNPKENVENSEIILDDGEWPNFHDAEVHKLVLWRGDVRPDDNVWIGPMIEATFELCALQNPYIAVLRFHDCHSIRMKEFNHQSAIYDLTFKYESRGAYPNGKPLPPDVSVSFEEAFGVALTFKCSRVQATERREINDTG